MKIIFHIGQDKTGTTTIQHYLRKNKKMLEEQGVLYPKSYEGGINHGVLSVPVLGRVQRSLVAKLGADYEGALKKSKKAWAQMGDEIRRKKPDIAIVSSEFFFVSQHVPQIAKMTDRYVGLDTEIEFLAYVRTPSQHYASAMQQKLKASHVVPPIRPAPVARQLKKFAKLGKVTVRKFARDQMEGGDAVQDFCKTVGINMDGLDLPPRETNTSISAEGIILLQEYRRTNHMDRDNVFTDDTTAFFERILAEEAAHPGVYTPARLRPEIAQALDAETDDTKSLKAAFGLDLAVDHGAEPLDREALEGLRDAAQIVGFDPEALENMRKALA